jgi:hypothetical protein
MIIARYKGVDFPLCILRAKDFDAIKKQVRDIRGVPCYVHEHTEEVWPKPMQGVELIWRECRP